MLQYIETESGLVNFKKVVEKAEEIVHIKREDEYTIVEFENGDALFFYEEEYNTIVQTLKELHELSKIFTGFSLRCNSFLLALCNKTIDDV